MNSFAELPSDFASPGNFFAPKSNNKITSIIRTLVETSNNKNIDMRAVMYFQHEIMVQPMPEERPELYDNGGE